MYIRPKQTNNVHVQYLYVLTLDTKLTPSLFASMYMYMFKKLVFVK